MRKEERFQLGEFWLDKRADGASDAWQITWFDGKRRQTRQRSTRTSDFELAKHRLAEHYIARGERHQEPAKSVFIEHVLMRYYETYGKKLASEHFVAYAIAHWKRFWKDETIEDMTEERITEFQKDLAKGENHAMKPATVNRVLGVGRAAIERAIAKKELVSGPSIPNVQVGRQRLYRASHADLSKLLNASEGMPWVRRWIIGSMVTLARPQAVLEISRPQLDFELRRVDLNPPGRDQTDKGRPIIPMTQTAYDWLSGDWTGLWITYRGKPLASIRMGFERARERAGLPTTFTPYTVRRTLSTELRRRGVAPWEIAGFLGHTVTEYAITEEYAIYSPDYLGHASKVLDAYCDELQPLLDFPLRTSRVPESVSNEANKVAQSATNIVVGRLGLEPRTNTLKGDRLPSKVSNLKARK